MSPRTPDSRLEELRALWRWTAENQIAVHGETGAWWASWDDSATDLRDHTGPARDPWVAVKALRELSNDRRCAGNSRQSARRAG